MASWNLSVFLGPTQGTGCGHVDGGVELSDGFCGRQNHCRAINGVQGRGSAYPNGDCGGSRLAGGISLECLTRCNQNNQEDDAESVVSPFLYHTRHQSINM